MDDFETLRERLRSVQAAPEEPSPEALAAARSERGGG